MLRTTMNSRSVTLGPDNKSPERLPSINEIEQSLQWDATATGVAACLCRHSHWPAPAGYSMPGTNKCSSSNPTTSLGIP